jgi:hypothetical protein
MAAMYLGTTKTYEAMNHVALARHTVTFEAIGT